MFKAALLILAMIAVHALPGASGAAMARDMMAQGMMVQDMANCHAVAMAHGGDCDDPAAKPCAVVCATMAGCAGVLWFTAGSALPGGGPAARVAWPATTAQHAGRSPPPEARPPRAA